MHVSVTLVLINEDLLKGSEGELEKRNLPLSCFKITAGGLLSQKIRTAVPQKSCSCRQFLNAYSYWLGFLRAVRGVHNLKYEWS